MVSGFLLQGSDTSLLKKVPDCDYDKWNTSVVKYYTYIVALGVQVVTIGLATKMSLVAWQD